MPSPCSAQRRFLLRLQVLAPLSRRVPSRLSTPQVWSRPRTEEMPYSVKAGRHKDLNTNHIFKHYIKGYIRKENWLFKVIFQPSSSQSRFLVKSESPHQVIPLKNLRSPKSRGHLHSRNTEGKSASPCRFTPLARAASQEGASSALRALPRQRRPTGGPRRTLGSSCGQSRNKRAWKH